MVSFFFQCVLLKTRCLSNVDLHIGHLKLGNDKVKPRLWEKSPSYKVKDGEINMKQAEWFLPPKIHISMRTHNMRVLERGASWIQLGHLNGVCINAFRSLVEVRDLPIAVFPWQTSAVHNTVTIPTDPTILAPWSDLQPLEVWGIYFCFSWTAQLLVIYYSNLN